MKIKIYKNLNHRGWFSSNEQWLIEKQPSSRDWLDNTGSEETNTKGYGNKCLPLKIGNQLGWMISFPTDVKCYLDPDINCISNKALKVEVADEKFKNSFKSHFGSGILTVTLPFVFRTKRNRQIYVRGPTNFFKENVMYMDAVIETDWMNFKFTYNIKIMKPGITVEFKKNEPFLSFIPINLEEIDKSYVEESSIYEDPLTALFASAYSEKRISLLNQHGSLGLIGAEIAEKTRASKTDTSNLNQKLSNKDHAFIENIKPHFWMKDYFLGGYASNSKDQLPAPEIGCPYLHFVNLKRERKSFDFFSVIKIPFKIIRFYLFKNLLFYHIYFKNKIWKNSPLNKGIRLYLKHCFRSYRKIKKLL